MIIIQNVLVSEEVLNAYFACDLQACRGACCWEGDYGAPLEDHELDELDQMGKKVFHLLPLESQQVMQATGASCYYSGPKKWGTSLRADGACIFMLTDQAGIATCALEKYRQEGLISGHKPQSCHLYPIRVVWQGTFETLHYDRWDICSPACSCGERERIPLVSFVREGLIRRYGEEFYQTLNEIAQQWRESKNAG